jgi:hypothetical protein
LVAWTVSAAIPPQLAARRFTTSRGEISTPGFNVAMAA